MNGKITPSPVPALDHPVPELGAPNWHGADFGTLTFQFQNWTTSAGTGLVQKWGLTYTIRIHTSVDTQQYITDTQQYLIDFACLPIYYYA